VLMAVKPKASVLKTWYTVRGDLLFIFAVGVALVLLAAVGVTDALIRRMKEAEDRRELALREVEHSQKLSSIGRLAAGVAHEVNNPLAIINEKAGLMKDILSLQGEFPSKGKILAQVESILRAVDRCRGITHRMLGFARRMDVTNEELDLGRAHRRDRQLPVQRGHAPQGGRAPGHRPAPAAHRFRPQPAPAGILEPLQQRPCGRAGRRSHRGRGQA
jgi:His Kinase A (phosphoacceptor) domain.